MRLFSFVFTCALVLAAPARADLIISQYYSGSGLDKWIEITNVGGNTVDLGASQVNLSVFRNQNQEGWKSGASTWGTITLSGILDAGESLLVGNTFSSTPVDAANSVRSWLFYFNGDDSVVLWNGSQYAFSNVVDAFGVTGSGFDDVSYVRNPDVLSGVNTDFNLTQWVGFSTVEVEQAPIGSTQRLGFHRTAAVPEPTSLALLGIPLLSAAGYRRLRKRRSRR